MRFLIASLLIVISCKIEDKNQIQISGSLSNSNHEKVYLEKITSNDIILIDSSEINQGEFLFKIKVDQINFYRLRLHNNSFINIILKPTDNVHVKADAKDFVMTAAISGSDESKELLRFNKYISNLYNTIDSVQKYYYTIDGEENDSLRKIVEKNYFEIIMQKDSFTKSFVLSNINSIVSLAAINYLNPDNNIALFMRLDSALMSRLPQLDYVKDFHSKVVSLSRLAVGNIAPDIILSNPEGKKVALSSIQVELILIDFWASWCAPCRNENPKLVSLYNKFHKKGFQIYGVSIDKSREEWVEAIQKDNLNWIHVSDLKYWNSPIIKLYEIESIPFSFLLDKDRKIIAKGLNSDELGKQVEKILNGKIN